MLRFRLWASGDDAGWVGAPPHSARRPLASDPRGLVALRDHAAPISCPQAVVALRGTFRGVGRPESRVGLLGGLQQGVEVGPVDCGLGREGPEQEFSLLGVVPLTEPRHRCAERAGIGCFGPVVLEDTLLVGQA